MKRGIVVLGVLALAWLALWAADTGVLVDSSPLL